MNGDVAFAAVRVLRCWQNPHRNPLRMMIIEEGVP
jgi:hypothetical protein